MKNKVYVFKNSMNNSNYVNEIKELMKNNPKVKTKAFFDEDGNYIINLMIPDWRDNLGFRPSYDIKGDIDSSERKNKKIEMKTHFNMEERIEEQRYREAKRRRKSRGFEIGE